MMQEEIILRIFIMVGGGITFLSTFVVLLSLRKLLSNTCKRKPFVLQTREIPVLLLLGILCVDCVYGLSIMCFQMFINLSYVCIIEGVVSGFCSVSSALLTACLARQSFFVAKYEVAIIQSEGEIAQETRARESFSGVLLLLGLAGGIPLCCVLGIAYFGGGFGNRYDLYPIPVTCHTITPTFGTEILGCYGWIWMSIFICIYYNARVTSLLYGVLKMGGDSSPQSRKLKQKLKIILAYPFIYALCCTPLSIYRMIRFSALRDGVDGDSRIKPTEAFYGFGQLMFILLGCFDALVLGCSNGKVRQQWCRSKISRQKQPRFVQLDQVALTSETSLLTADELMLAGDAGGASNNEMAE